MTQIDDIMTREVFAFPPGVSKLEAAWTLTARGLGGAPVHDRRGRRVAAVEDVMVRGPLVLRPADPAMRAVHMMVERGAQRVVVLDAEDRFVGFVTPMDVLRALAAGKSLGAPEEEAP